MVTKTSFNTIYIPIPNYSMHNNLKIGASKLNVSRSRDTPITLALVMLYVWCIFHRLSSFRLIRGYSLISFVYSCTDLL